MHRTMPTSSSVDKSPLKLFLLIFVLSIPFWLVDGLTQLPKGVPINLPVSSPMAFNPLIAVLILTYRYNKSAGIKDLLKRAFDYKRTKEMRWLGYAIDPMQDRWGALRASIIMGAVWGLWHLWGIFKLTMGQNG